MRRLNEQSPRVETGTVRFGDDWPGVFIRGDDARALAQVLRYCLRESARQGHIYSRLDFLAVLLESSQVKERA
jgi:hypothetical protein